MHFPVKHAVDVLTVISYTANNPTREKKRRTIWHNSFLNLQKQALITRTEMFFWKKIMFFKIWAQQAELLRRCHRRVNAIEGNEHQGRLLTPETPSGNQMSLICMENNEQCIVSLSLGHNLGLWTCNQLQWETLSVV